MKDLKIRPEIRNGKKFLDSLSYDFFLDMKSKAQTYIKLNSFSHAKETKWKGRGFTGGSEVKNLPSNAGDTSSISDLVRLHISRSN